MTAPSRSAAADHDTGTQVPVGDHRIDVEHLTKRYGDHTVVNDLSFSVPAGRDGRSITAHSSPTWRARPS